MAIDCVFRKTQYFYPSIYILLTTWMDQLLCSYLAQPFSPLQTYIRNDDCAHFYEYDTLLDLSNFLNKLTLIGQFS